MVKNYGGSVLISVNKTLGSCDFGIALRERFRPMADPVEALLTGPDGTTKLAPWPPDSSVERPTPSRRSGPSSR